MTGSGFVAGSLVFWNHVPHPTSYLDAAHLTATISAADLLGAAVVDVAVLNSAPGGGLSASRPFTVANPVPTLSSITPATAVAGSGPYLLDVSGTNILGGATVRFNGQSRATTVVSPTALRATLLDIDLAAAGSANVTVANVGPGGGDSAPKVFTITAPPPRIAASMPVSVATGAAAFQLTLQGSGFTASSTATWNGTARPVTWLSASSLRLDVAAADVASAGSAAIIVSDPASPAPGFAYGFPVLAASPGVTSTLTVTLTAKDLVWDSQRNEIYASVGSAAPALANSIVRINPANGALLGSIATGSDPGLLALSDDASKLYVSLDGAAKVQRIDLATRTAETPFALGNDFFGLSLVAGDLQAMPGNPQTVVVARRMTGTTPPSGGIAVYDDGVQRPVSTSSAVYGTYNDTVSFVAPDQVYSYDQSVSSFELSRVQILPEGAVSVSKVNPFSGYGIDVRFDSGRFYASTGLVAELDGTLAGSFALASTSSHHPAWSRGRAFFLSGATLSAFTPSSFTVQGSVTLSPAAGQGRFELWGKDGIAYRTATQVVLVRSPLIGG